MKKLFSLKYALAAIAPLLLGIVAPVLLALNGGAFVTGAAYAAGTPNFTTSKPYCGAASYQVNTAIDLGCAHFGNPIEALIFAIIKLLSDGVGLVIIASLIVAGIQFTASRDEPQAKAIAIKRIQSNLTAFLLYCFAYAIIFYLIPASVLQQAGI
jgi:hypothetical protein